MEPDYRCTLRRHYSRLGFAVFAFLAVTTLAQLGLHLLLSYASPRLTEAGWYYPALTILPTYLLGFPVFLLILPKAPPKSLLPEKQSIPFRELVMLLIMCFGILYPGNLLGQGLDRGIRYFLRLPAQSSAVELLAGSSSLWAYGLATVVLGPVMEELTFRKLLLDRMRPIDKPAALLFSALAFGLFHGNLIQFFYAFGVGVVFGCIYLRSGRLRVTVLLHMLVNFVGGFLPILLTGDLDLDALDLSRLDPEKLMDSLLPLLGVGLYSLCLLSLAAAGIVLLIRHRRSFRVGDGADRLQGGDRFLLPYVNPGFLLYFIAAMGVFALNYL